MPFRLAKVDDFLDLETSNLKRSSYKNVGYPLGCSMSELDVALGDGDFVLFNETSIVGFIRIKAMFEGIAYFDLHVLSDWSDVDVQAVMNWLADEYDLGKFYVQLLPYELLEIDCLTRLGFKEEARLSKQLFIDGSYYDVLMMGSEDQRVR